MWPCAPRPRLCHTFILNDHGPQAPSPAKPLAYAKIKATLVKAFLKCDSPHTEFAGRRLALILIMTFFID